MTIEVIRTSFFSKPPKTLAYEEHSPGRKCEAHSICGCTDMVTERPEGEPAEVKQQVLFKGTHRGFEGTVNITGQALWSTFRWDRRPEDEAIRVDKSDRGGQDHACFMFSPGRVNLEIAIPGYGRVDYFFGHIYLGNKVDFSTLYNGHSPSRIVNAEKVSAETLWVHNCSWGHEAMKVFLDSREAQDWRSWFRAVEEVLAQTQHSLTEDVHGIRAALEASGVEKLVVGLQEQLATLLRDFRQTETYRLCDEVAEKIKPQRS
jgi:hypothetical protein